MSTWRPIRKEAFFEKWLPWWLNRFIFFGIRLGIIAAVVAIGVVFFYIYLALKFDLSEVTKLPDENRFLDSQKRELVVGGQFSREQVSRDEIPEFLVQALLAREDAKFFEHRGVDIRGLARAMLRNVKDGGFTQGASTLSMQLTRNVFQMREKSLHRKALEIALTARIECHYTKDEILTSYLNRIYFGSGAYGLAEAADIYFSKESAQLSDAECAMLVGIIRGPHIFSPFRNLQAALEQRDQTLARMVQVNFVTKEEARKISEEPIILAGDREKNSVGSYAEQALKRELRDLIEERDLRSGGLIVHTMMNRSWQEQLAKAMHKTAARMEQRKGYTEAKYSDYKVGEEVAYFQFAAVTIHTKTGAILAYVGGRNSTHSTYDRTRSKRDLGAAFEPFLAAAAAERGKLVFLNSPVQTGRQLGVEETIRVVKRSGLSGPFLETEDLFRGSVAATPLEAAKALATMKNQGKRPEPYFITKIENKKGKVVYRANPDQVPALNARNIDQVLPLFTKSGGARFFSGATGSERDAWIFRYGPSGSTAIWLGFDKPRRIASEQELKSLLQECMKELGR